MGVNEMKSALRQIPGAEGLTLAYAPNGDELITIAGRTVQVSPTASNAEIALAFATPHPTSSANVTAVPPAPVAGPVPVAPPLAAATIPPVTMAAAAPIAPIAAPVTSKSMSITGAAPATLSIKQIIESSRQTVQAAHQKLTTNANKVAQAAAALDSLGDDLGKEGDDLLAMIGQYKNDLGAA